MDTGNSQVFTLQRPNYREIINFTSSDQGADIYDSFYLKDMIFMAISSYWFPKHVLLGLRRGSNGRSAHVVRKTNPSRQFFCPPPHCAVSAAAGRGGPRRGAAL